MNEKISLKKKAAGGIYWTVLDFLGYQGIQFFIQIILARLLLPEHFGLIGIVLIFINISNSLVDSGFSQALIRDKNTTNRDYSTIFYFNIMLSIFIYLLLFASSKPISLFFDEPAIVNILKVFGLLIILNALGIVKKVVLTKNLNFKYLTKINLFSNGVSGVIAVYLASIGMGIWVLVIHNLLSKTIYLVLIWRSSEWTPSLTFSKISLKKYYSFGIRLLISNLIDSIYRNSLSAIIGKQYSATQLGYYTNAVKLKDMISQSISVAVQRVSYPVLSTIQDDNDRLRESYRKIIKLSVFFHFPLIFGTAAIAPVLVLLIFGEKWIPMVSYFQILSVAGLLYPLQAINFNILQIKNRSDLFIKLELIKKTVFTVLLVIAIFSESGILGLMVASVINSYVSLFISAYTSGKEINYNLYLQLKDVYPTLINSIIMGFFVWLAGEYLNQSAVFLMIVQIITGIFIYIVLSFLFNKKEIQTLKNFLKHFNIVKERV
ncbi:hypothetical protein Plano_2322 [Planococcus sp. PAMC 21323]|uniref:lipopolysaccharide biosynthesis protein n=1 Tax=Planococcus sp. PAMC 21323 TaxID=1526927 RepID=UPI000571B6E4|nr:lipopolysaccharide biosynthesis protein [Planococcus sp. PAMC 21323]AIY06287.1 hypothetical protein Plano_2322 [Planococcus sp. PAMC 21323]